MRVVIDLVDPCRLKALSYRASPVDHPTISPFVSARISRAEPSDALSGRGRHSLERRLGTSYVQAADAVGVDAFGDVVHHGGSQRQDETIWLNDPPAVLASRPLDEPRVQSEEVMH